MKHALKQMQYRFAVIHESFVESRLKRDRFHSMRATRIVHHLTEVPWSSSKTSEEKGEKSARAALFLRVNKKKKNGAYNE